MKALKPLGSRIISVEEALKIAQSMPDVNKENGYDPVRIDELMVGEWTYYDLDINTRPFSDEGELIRLNRENAKSYCLHRGFHLPSIPLMYGVLTDLQNKGRGKDLKKLLSHNCTYLTDTKIDWGEKEFSFTNVIEYVGKFLSLDRQFDQVGFRNLNEITAQFVQNLTQSPDYATLDTLGTILENPIVPETFDHKCVATMYLGESKIMLSTKTKEDEVFPFLGFRYGGVKK